MLNGDPVRFSRDEMERYLSLVDWSSMFAPLNNCEEMWNAFYGVVHTGLDLLMPEKQNWICTADASWMTQKLQSLILKRQNTFNKNGADSAKFKYYRNLVNRERKTCIAKHYKLKIQQMKGGNPKRWWKEVKRLSNMKVKNGDVTCQMNVDEFSNLSQYEQADAINAAFLEPLQEYRLPTQPARLPLEESPEFLNVTESRVEKALVKLNPGKATGPDEIPNCFLKEYLNLVAFPFMYMLNASYREQCLPTVWKMADVSPVPKTKFVHDPKKDLRPISLTPCASKVAEDLLVEDSVKPAILKVIDLNQYEVIPKSSTTIALISMLHHWYPETDGNGATVRTILFDYRKAFDFIDHSILIDKLCKIDLPRNVVNWIIDFLADRFQ